MLSGALSGEQGYAFINCRDWVDVKFAVSGSFNDIILVFNVDHARVADMCPSRYSSWLTKRIITQYENGNAIDLSLDFPLCVDQDGFIWRGAMLRP